MKNEDKGADKGLPQKGQAGKDRAAIWQRDEIESPCIAVCLVHPVAGICTGCGRTVEEITRWSSMTPQERRAIMDALPERMKGLAQRRGGRRGRLARKAGSRESRPAGGRGGAGVRGAPR